ncbi:hypothetical protein V1260_14935 [Brachybacterium sp. J144]|uniref:hypothetical protein n=1 Tax=Brachybacterium sp. J144 TaxID=3116487 RepID=UPI002E76DF85|nr:hypothetical protein [Brachybacterium sp. J144]MEE1652074.1 hypothetical protein [Brachybacterium sp. J144]
MSTADRPGPDPEDVDAEFARLTQGLDLGDGELTVEDLLGAAPEGAAPAAEPAVEEEQIPAVAVVATTVADARALAGVIRLGREARTDGIDIPAGTRTHDASTGAVAVGPLQETAAHDLAAIASSALQRNGIVLFWRRGDRMTATRYRNGERGEDVSPAIVLGAVDDLVEQLLLGALELSDLGEGADPVAMSRAEALEAISGGEQGGEGRRGRGRRR